MHKNHEMRKVLKWAGTQSELAKRLKVSRQAIWQALQEGYLSERLCFRLAKVAPWFNTDRLMRVQK